MDDVNAACSAATAGVALRRACGAEGALGSAAIQRPPNDGPSQRGPSRLPLSNMAVDLPSCQRAPALSTCPAPHTRPPAISPTELAVLTPKSRLCNMETPRHRSTAPHEAVHRLRLCTT